MGCLQCFSSRVVSGFSHYSLLIGVHKRELKWVSNCSLNGMGIQHSPSVIWVRCVQLICYVKSWTWCRSRRSTSTLWRCWLLISFLQPLKFLSNFRRQLSWSWIRWRQTQWFWWICSTRSKFFSSWKSWSCMLEHHWDWRRSPWWWTWGRNLLYTLLKQFTYILRWWLGSTITGSSLMSRF